MEYIFESMSSVFCLLFVIFITCLYIYSTSTFNYWKDRGVVHLKPLPFFGTSINLVFRKTNLVQEFESIYTKFKNERFIGTYGFLTPTLFVRDPVLINEMMTSDFQHFHDKSGFVANKKLNPLNSNLLNLTGTEWKNLRKKLSPVFTSGKLSTMTDELQACAEDLVTVFEEKLVNCCDIEVGQVMRQFTTKVIGSIAFGCLLNTLNDSNSEFLKHGQKIFQVNFRSVLAFFMDSFSPRLRDFLRLKSLPKDVEDFYFNFVKESIAYREKNNYQRNDYLQLLINLRNDDKSGVKNSYTETEQNRGDKPTEEKDVVLELSESEDGTYCPKRVSETELILDDTLIAANVFIFFIAGYETTASTLSNCLLELAANQDIQHKLRDEILTAMKKNEKLSYEILKGMKYLEQVISETLRKYSVVIYITRICTQKYKIPNTEVVIDKGVKVVIPVYSIHKDPQFYPDPEKFEPERFSEENKKNRQNGTYLPFGGGPRMCTGLRFALLEIKMALVHVLSRYQFSMTNKMAYPLEFSKKSFLVAPKDGIWLKVSKI